MSANLQLFSETDKQNQKNFKIENSHWKMNGKTYQELEESEKRAYIEALEVERYNQSLQVGIIAKDYLHLLCIRMANNAFSPKPKTGKFYPDIDKILKYIYTYCNYECECDTNFLIDDEAYKGSTKTFLASLLVKPLPNKLSFKVLFFKIISKSSSFLFLNISLKACFTSFILALLLLIT